MFIGGWVNMLCKESVKKIEKALSLLAQVDEVVDDIDKAYDLLWSVLEYNEYLERLENNK